VTADGPIAGARGLLKHLLEATLTSRGAQRLGQYRRRGQRLILAYHDVVPAGTAPTGDRSLHLDFDAFRSQLDLLERTNRVTALETALDPQSSGACIALTFDDAYAGAVTLGLPEVSSRGLPATLFVAPGLLGHAACWWDLLAARNSGLPRAVRDVCLETYKGDYLAVINWACSIRESLPVGEWWRIASEAELALAAKLPGLTLAAHSWSHPNLTAVSPARLEEELRKPLAWLRHHYPMQTRPWLAYPYGLHDGRVASAADAAGYEVCFAITGGWHPPGVTRSALPRLNVPAGVSPAGFRARLSGWLSSG
jgi:peptidoglycan/xylan/chitin deacetylase (PgdA/CDA1 family)